MSRSGVQQTSSPMQGSKQINNYVYAEFKISLVYVGGYSILEQLAATHAAEYIPVKTRAEREEKKNRKFTTGTGRDKPKKKDTQLSGKDFIN